MRTDTSLAEARAALDGLKAELMARGEATDLFARDRGDGLASLLGNLDQSVFGEPVINDVGLAALTLLVAESDPANKDTMIRLVMNTLVGDQN